jgi:hypothetical protein
VSLTSHVGNAKHSDAALLEHAALVWEQRDRSRRGTRRSAGCTAVGKVVAGVGARLVGSLLYAVSTRLDVGEGGKQMECCTY